MKNMYFFVALYFYFCIFDPLFRWFSTAPIQISHHLSCFTLAQLFKIQLINPFLKSLQFSVFK